MIMIKVSRTTLIVLKIVSYLAHSLSVFSLTTSSIKSINDHAECHPSLNGMSL